MLDHALDRLAEAGIERRSSTSTTSPSRSRAISQRRARRAIVDLGRARRAARDRRRHVKKALPLLGAEPFFVLNSDSLWIEGPRSNLRRLIAALGRRDSMDILLLLAATVDAASAMTGSAISAWTRRGACGGGASARSTPFVYAGVAILKPELFADAPDGAFSLNLLFDRAIEAGRLYRVAARRPVAACRHPGGDRGRRRTHRRERALRGAWPDAKPPSSRSRPACRSCRRSPTRLLDGACSPASRRRTARPADATIFLPTRRAARAFAELLAERAGGAGAASAAHRPARRHRRGRDRLGRRRVPAARNGALCLPPSAIRRAG